MEADDISRLYGYVNTITAANSTIQYGMAAYNCRDFTWTNSTIKNFTTGRGVYLENVTAFVMSGGSIQSNEYGIESYRSNIFLRNKAQVKLNATGIEFYTNRDGYDDLPLPCMLTVGDIGCGWIINNDVGVHGEDVHLEIDQLDDLELNPNRFDGNGDIFNFCISPEYVDEISPFNKIDASGNYWGGSTPVINSDYTIGYTPHCNVVSLDPLTDYVTTAPSSCACLTVYPCIVYEESTNFAINARINQTSCTTTIPNQTGNGNITIGRQYLDANHLFITGDYKNAYYKFRYLINTVDSIYPQGISGTKCRSIYNAARGRGEMAYRLASIYCDIPDYYELRESAAFNTDQFLIFPNPAANTITIKPLYSENYSYKIISFTGQLIDANTFAQTITIDLRKTAQGIYFIQFLNAGHEIIETQKLIIQK